jgi:hypothetical protein
MIKINKFLKNKNKINWKKINKIRLIFFQKFIIFL